jgi:hypothetical protein
MSASEKKMHFFAFFFGAGTNTSPGRTEQSTDYWIGVVSRSQKKPAGESYALPEV